MQHIDFLNSKLERKATRKKLSHNMDDANEKKIRNRKSHNNKKQQKSTSTRMTTTPAPNKVLNFRPKTNSIIIFTKQKKIVRQIYKAKLILFG